MSLRNIAKELNSTFGLTKRGKQWSYKSVQYILANNAYVATLSGLLEKKIHYRVEEANIEPIIDPLLFQFIQQKLHHHKSGRKVLSSPTLPTFAVCADCAHLLTYRKSKYVCDTCNNQYDAKELKKILHDQIQEVISQVQCSPKRYSEKRLRLIERYLLQRKKVINRITDLEERRVYIQNIMQSNSTGKMIEANTLEKKKAKEQLQFIEEMLGFLGESNEALMEGTFILDDTYLIKLPYLVIIDFPLREVAVMFHNQVYTKKEDSFWR